MLVSCEGVLAVLINSFELPIRVRARRVRPTKLGIRFYFLLCPWVCTRLRVSRVCVCVSFLSRRHFSIDQATTIIAIVSGDRFSLDDVDFILLYCSVLLLCYCFNRFSSLAVRHTFWTFYSALNYISKAIWWLKVANN